MGFYIRKSISVGPFRFNLSNSGVGVSAGVKGFRIGSGPRGNYVHVGRGGLYYRATIPSANPAPATPTSARLKQGPPRTPATTHAPLEEIESSHVSKIVDSSSKALLDELSAKRARPRLWPLVACLTLVLLAIGLFRPWPAWAQIATALIGAVAIYFVYMWDVVAKTVVVFYEFDNEMESAYDRLHDAANRIASCSAAWHVAAAGAVHDRKYHAGASSVVERKSTFVRKDSLPFVKTNIETVALGVGRQVLHFFPDRVLIYDSDGVGGVGYDTLRLQVSTTRFIEDGSVPADAEVVGTTWRYVNKNGGPDRRFKDNRELSVCRYEEISLSSTTGLNELVQLSKCGFGAEFAAAIANLGQKLRQ